MTANSSPPHRTTEARRAWSDGVPFPFPAVLLWPDEVVVVPEDASAAALRRLRAEALEAIDRMAAHAEACV